MAAASPTAWRQFAGGVRLNPQAAMGGISLVIIAVLLLTVALSGGGRDLLPWTLFRLVILGLLTIAFLGGSLRRTALTYPLAGALVAIAVTSIWSVRLQSSVDQFIIWITYTALFLLVASTISSLKPARRFVDAAVFSGGALCLIGLYWFWGAGNPTMRWYSTFYWPNPFAGFLLLLIPVEVFRCSLAPTRREALTHGAMAVLMGTAFVLTLSRGAWIAAAVTAGLAAIALRTFVDRAAAVRAAAIVVAVAASVFLLTGGQALRSPATNLLTRVASTADLTEYSLQGRLHFWRGAVDIFRDHPLVGTGPGTYTYMYPQYQRDVRFYARDPHNLFAQMASDSGIIGLAVLIWLMGALAALGVRAIRTARGTPELPWVAGVVFGLGAFWLHTGMEMNWSFPATPAMAFALMGVLASYDSLAPVRPRPERAAASPRIERRRHRWISIAAASATTIVMAAVGVQYAAVSQFRKGQVAYAAGRWQPAADAFVRASALNPLDPRYPSALADALAKTGRPPATVIPLVRRASGLDRANPYYWVQLAQLHRALSTPTADRAAEAALRMAIALDPFHYPEAYRSLAELHRTRRDPAGALDVYRQAAARYPDSVATDFALRPFLWPGVVALFLDWAELLVEQQRYAEAGELYARIVRHEPRFARAIVRLAQLYRTMGRIPDAVRVVAEGLKHLPDNGQLLALARELRAMAPDLFR